MPLLTPNSVHIDQPLTNLTIAYVQDQANFIADKVFPTVGVDKQSDKYYIYDRDNMNRTGDVKALAPRTEVNRIGMSLSTDSFYAEVYGLGMDHWGAGPRPARRAACRQGRAVDRGSAFVI